VSFKAFNDISDNAATKQGGSPSGWKYEERFPRKNQTAVSYGDGRFKFQKRLWPLIRGDHSSLESVQGKLGF